MKISKKTQLICDPGNKVNLVTAVREAKDVLKKNPGCEVILVWSNGIRIPIRSTSTALGCSNYYVARDTKKYPRKSVLSSCPR